MLVLLGVKFVVPYIISTLLRCVLLRFGVLLVVCCGVFFIVFATEKWLKAERCTEVGGRSVGGWGEGVAYSRDEERNVD